MKKFFVLMLAAVALFAACNKDEEKKPELSLSLDSVEAPAEGGSYTVEITSNIEWTVTTDGQTWYSLDKTSGENNGVLSITIDNNGTASAREASVIISGEGMTYYVTISQAALPVPEAISNDLKFVGDSQVLDYELSADYDYSVESDVDWITVVKGEGKFTLNIAENNSSEVRVGNVVARVSDDNLLAEIVIKQYPKAAAPKPGEFLIEEVYFTGSLIEGAGSSSGDQYIKITNNSDHPVYADGILFCMNYINGFKTSVGAHYDYPALDSEGIAVTNMYRIPGSGADHVVYPDESLILAINAQNYKEENPNAIDLSKADFEFNDVNDIYPDTDNPDVEDLIIWFKSSRTITSLHNRGFESYAIVLPPAEETAESIMTNHHWTGSYTFDFTNPASGQTYHFEYDIADDDAFLIPAEWVLDAVNCSTEDSFYRNPWGAAFDAGWTHAGDFDGDISRFGKSVRRDTVNGKLVDTNNSTNDFIPNATPTLKK